MMGVAESSETLVNFYETAGRNNPDELDTRLRENLKFYFRFYCSGPALL
jgi:hypothetical protein